MALSLERGGSPTHNFAYAGMQLCQGAGGPWQMQLYERLVAWVRTEAGEAVSAGSSVGDGVHAGRMLEVLVVVCVGSGVMNMTEKNGQPSMEEILASIRRIIAEEPPGPHPNSELRGTPIMLKGDGVLEDAGDFDLPAIFRSSPPAQTERPTPLLGRLTDAIRGATAAQPEPRGTFNGEELVHADAVEGGALSSEPAYTYSGLSSLKPVRPADAGPANPAHYMDGAPFTPESPPVAHQAAAVQPTASAGPSGPEPKRQMAAFKDTHFLRMSAPTAAVPAPAAIPAPAVPPVVEAAPLPAPEPVTPVDFSAIIPGQFDRSALAAGQTPPPIADPASAPPPVAAAPTVVAMPPPPPLPGEPVHNALVVAGAQGHEETGSIEDTTADLLRPMLRQWLADNMPRMVEKALHIEIAESVKLPKKP